MQKAAAAVTGIGHSAMESMGSVALQSMISVALRLSNVQRFNAETLAARSSSPSAFNMQLGTEAQGALRAVGDVVHRMFQQKKVESPVCLLRVIADVLRCSH